LETLIKVFLGGPAGLDTMGHQIDTANDTLQDEIEPFLLRLGFIIRTPRGRVATPEAFDHLNCTPPGSHNQGPQKSLF
ncbi:MAG: Holliday junction branch migration DNA helicase RuvB, partial [Planctomycetales bacterium]